MPEKGWRRLPDFVVDDLRSIGLHLAFASWNTRKHFHEAILCTDATPTSAGAARANWPRPLQRSCTRGALLASLDEWKEPTEPSTWASVLGRTLRWSAWSSYTFRNTSHFNLKDGRAPKNKVHKMALSPKIFGCVQLCLNDSRVICGAVSKGGSSSFKLNCLLRSMLPHLIFANISLALIWGRQMQILQIIQAVFGLYGLPCLFLVGCEDWE